MGRNVYTWSVLLEKRRERGEVTFDEDIGLDWIGLDWADGFNFVIVQSIPQTRLRFMKEMIGVEEEESGEEGEAGEGGGDRGRGVEKSGKGKERER